MKKILKEFGNCFFFFLFLFCFCFYLCVCVCVWGGGGGASSSGSELLFTSQVILVCCVAVDFFVFSTHCDMVFKHDNCKTHLFIIVVFPLKKKTIVVVKIR